MERVTFRNNNMFDGIISMQSDRKLSENFKRNDRSSSRSIPCLRTNTNIDRFICFRCRV